MEAIRGRQSLIVTACALQALVRRYDDILIDIGSGDGSYVRHMARSSPAILAIGVDACRENLREISRRSPDNTLYVIANALALPPELAGLAGRITVNFPWGSLLEGLQDGHPDLMRGLAGLARPGAELEVRANGGALLEQGRGLENGAASIRESLTAAGFVLLECAPLGAAELRAVPTSWARRLAFGRDPRGFYLRAVRLDEPLANIGTCTGDRFAI